MRAFIVLLLALSIFANANNTNSPESIDEFIKYLHETKFFDIFLKIKVVLGTEAAYFTCEEFLYNRHCEEVVRIYMPNYLKVRRLASIIFEKLNEILFSEESLLILKSNNIEEKTIKEVILRVEKRFQKS